MIEKGVITFGSVNSDSGERTLLRDLLEGRTVQSVTVDELWGEYIDIQTDKGFFRLGAASCCQADLYLQELSSEES